MYLKCQGNGHRTASALGIGETSVRRRLTKFAKITGSDIGKPQVVGDVYGFKSIKYKLPAKGRIARYIVTTAQNNTKVHKNFWNNLLALAKHYKAEVMVSQISYNKAKYGKKAVKAGRGPTEDDKAELWFDDCLEEYFFNDRIFVAPTLALCGEQNILPTAVSPLSGFETYPGDNASAVFPHTTIALASIPVMPGTPVKFNYTTGAVTQKNYIQKKEGLKAEFHHSYGALLIEVDSSGDWWVRQINATEDGGFYDLDLCVKGGKVTSGHLVEAINWGDLHVDVMDPMVQKTNWGTGGIIDVLKPRYQLCHDTLDFHSRNHHSRSDPHKNFTRWVEGRENVQEEVQRVNEFLSTISYRPFCQSVVVGSNHDNALTRWLREADYKSDPVNAEFFLLCQGMQYKALRERNKDFHLVESVLKVMGVRSEIKFLRADESFVICKESGGIELGIHGHAGPNGSKGSPKSLSHVGRRANTGHTHSASIITGLYTAGTCSKLQLEYTEGPSSWSWSHVLTYKNGKRCIVHMKPNGKWRG